MPSRSRRLLTKNMLNKNPLNGPKAVIALFVMMLTFLGAASQDLFPNVRMQEKFTGLSLEKGSFDIVSDEAAVAPALTVTPISWGVTGLDSNNVTAGPDTFPVGARVCNTGNAAAINVTSAFVWDTANALVNLRTGSSSSVSAASLGAGACTDFYYEVAITRSSSAYDATRSYHITATADTLGVVSTPTPREFYVERLVSQNRNSVSGIKLNGVSVPFGGTMNLVVGNTYTIQLIGSTATNGYEQLASFINLPNVIFQTLSVSSTYSAPSGYNGNKVYEDACGWNSDPANGTYRSCTGPANIAGGKVGGAVTLTYTVKVMSGAGTSQTLNTLIYDFSGSSYHYNSDFSSSSVIAQIVAAPTAANVSVGGRVTLSDGRGLANARVILTEANGTMHLALTGRRGFYNFSEIPDGQSVMVSVRSRRFTFSQPVRVISLTDNIADLDFVADQ